MSELKAFDLKAGKNLETDSPIVVGVDNKWNSRIMSGEEVYLKSEADKVIEEKDKEIAELKEKVSEERSAKVDYKISANDLSNGLEKAYAEISHHKYKRCLAMAKICEDKLGTVVKPGWWDKWRKRWLELAEKFKEAK